MFAKGLFLIISSLTIPLIFIGFPPSATETRESSLLLIAQQEDLQIKEEDVEQLIKQTDEAIDKQNVAEILSYFAPFAYSEITLDTDRRSETLKINGLEEHRQYLQDSFAEIKSKEVLFDDYQISLASDGAIAYVYRTRLVNFTYLTRL